MDTLSFFFLFLFSFFFTFTKHRYLVILERRWKRHDDDVSGDGSIDRSTAHMRHSALATK